jgi:hypothetical protein
MRQSEYRAHQALAAHRTARIVETTRVAFAVPAPRASVAAVAMLYNASALHRCAVCNVRHAITQRCA